MLALFPLEALSGGMTPRESMPGFYPEYHACRPKTRFATMAQAVLFRGAGFDVVWPQFHCATRDRFCAIHFFFVAPPESAEMTAHDSCESNLSPRMLLSHSTTPSSRRYPARSLAMNQNMEFLS
ncbi:hypothetical protein B2M20_07850 [Nitrobacter vulgaris]|uniref:Uncharacterized protein n=1 Tax=Nitrobacter vulgaris TaxID=29421 RepID=A0A1V4HZA4_NITVU|nr:hypothetical protein B2M20_07850 [Nitrobacter vulgaris]